MPVRCRGGYYKEERKKKKGKIVQKTYVPKTSPSFACPLG